MTCVTNVRISTSWHFNFLQFQICGIVNSTGPLVFHELTFQFSNFFAPPLVAESPQRWRSYWYDPHIHQAWARQQATMSPLCCGTQSGMYFITLWQSKAYHIAWGTSSDSSSLWAASEQLHWLSLSLHSWTFISSSSALKNSFTTLFWRSICFFLELNPSVWSHSLKIWSIWVLYLGWPMMNFAMFGFLGASIVMLRCLSHGFQTLTDEEEDNIQLHWLVSQPRICYNSDQWSHSSREPWENSNQNMSPILYHHHHQIHMLIHCYGSIPHLSNQECTLEYEVPGSFNWYAYTEVSHSHQDRHSLYWQYHLSHTWW